ncbi:MAG: pyridoxamine 5'-phosphate oxidase family protein [Bosea sp. (in: a-proteobacteria)]|uniref:pyridoxamine 5'-phosphate oxidase family protein n=1 Tax=Bosea sp. (in: a-proteobacteria) TaxID=1871050 RepID=UPI0027336B32|nr:pyridoxamine 5'-phosphate oxidase family protein [Bosea sp. (in: a-proteobacteria)]MDP3257025.1 pyridoxamine 5'-phosphate oxidase family protein [Bosea sp. (in: a-proteobacteria)]MDP3319530.1 pyridoxamine 5'-phosphate oxidase family protein [Bosea sp. (in: a-proteobacteria)]
MPAHTVTSPEQLAALYPNPVAPASVHKEIDHVDGNYAALIAASPFFVLATNGPEGLDCSPRGDQPGFVTVRDAKTLLIPDRKGNNRLDSLKNILFDPRIGMLFLIPGYGETLRVNGVASLSDDPELRGRFEMAGKLPACVIVVAVESVYFQCSRAIVRAELWNAERHVDRSTVPSAGTILRDITARNAAVETFDGEAYDRALPERVRATLY